jgi:hypothetical protein
MQELIDLLEVTWVLAAFIGLSVCQQSLRDAVLDRTYLEILGVNGARSLVAQAAVRRERLQMATLGFFAATGVVVLLSPRLIEWGIAPFVIASGIRVAVCFAIGQIIVVSLLDRRDRAAVIADKTGGRGEVDSQGGRDVLED